MLPKAAGLTQGGLRPMDAAGEGGRYARRGRAVSLACANFRETYATFRAEQNSAGAGSRTDPMNKQADFFGAGGIKRVA